jgi:hypothetical protein
MTRPEISLQHMSKLFGQGCQDLGETIIFSINGVGKTGYVHAKE